MAAQHARGIDLDYLSVSEISSKTSVADHKISILTSASGKRATKRFTIAGIESYAKEGNWRWREVGVTTFADLARLLSQVEADPLSLIVQGVVTPAWRDKTIIRRTKSKGEPSLEDGGSRVIHFDIDDLPLPIGTGWQDPEGVARTVWQAQIVAKVPAFDGVSVWWQASSSAGTPGREHLAKLHFWALLDRPIDEAQRKALLKLAGADDSLASINQPNYVARPIFDGVQDPLAGVARSGVILGAYDEAPIDRIAWPEAAIKRSRAHATKRQAGPAVAPAGLTHGTTDAGRDLLDNAFKQISTAPQGGRNSLINRVAFAIGGHVAGGSIAYVDALKMLMDAGLASGHDRYAEAVNNGLRDGLQRPIAPKADPNSIAIAPYHPAPAGDRAAAIAAHPATINAWADQNIPIMQATKAIARAYAEIEHPEADDPERESKLLEVKKAQSAIRRQIRDQFGLDYLPASEITQSAPITRAMLTGAQGVGKTRAVVGANGKPGILHRATGLVSILFEPDHGMAAQARTDFDNNAPAGAPPSITLRGRGSPDPDQESTTMCRIAEIAGRLAARGVSVRKALCETCPFAETCGYLKQEAEILRLTAEPEGLAIFAPHDYAFLPLPGMIEPDLAIFDERPRDMGVEAEAGLSFEILSEPLEFSRSLRIQSPMQNANEAADAQAANLRFIKPLMIALRNAGQDHPTRLLGALRASGVTREQIIGAIAGLVYFQDNETAHAMREALKQWEFATSFGRKGFDLEKRLSAEIDSREGKIARTLQTIFAALLVEIDAPRDDLVGIVVSDVQRRPGGSEKAKGIVAFKLKALRLGRIPFLHLDGTGDHGLAQMVFGPMDIEHHPVERSPAERGDRIIQVTGADFHNAGLTGGRKAPGGAIEAYSGSWEKTYADQRRDITEAIATRPCSLVVGNKRVIEALNPNQHAAHAAHFGAIRGRNDWERLDQILVIGREEPSPAAVERIARAFAARLPEPFESLAGGRYPQTERGIRKRDGTGRGISVNFHPNAWADRVLRQIRDAEIEQAIDRIRPIFKAEPIEVLLFSPVALDLTVDQIISFQDFRKGGTRVERAMAQSRVVPLSPREAARLMPNIWAGKTTAERDLEGEGLLAQTLNRVFYLRNGPIRNLVVAIYRAEAEPGKRSHEHKALIAAAPEQAREILEALTGPLRHFEVVQVIKEPQAAVAKAIEPLPANPLEIARQGQAVERRGRILPARHLERPDKALTRLKFGT